MINLGLTVKEAEVFINCLREKDLKLTVQRKMVIDAFLQAIPHISAEELYDRLKNNNKTIGLTTVYRTLKLLRDCGLADVIRLSDGIIRYEPVFGLKQHDHLICLQCGRMIEAVNPEIEEIQQRLAQTNGFKVLSYRLEMYGICKECLNN